MLGEAIRIIGHKREREGEIPLQHWPLGLRQVRLVSALQRRAKRLEPHPDDETAIDEAEKWPAFYGLQEPPSSELTGQQLIKALNEDGRPMFDVATTLGLTQNRSRD